MSNMERIIKYAKRVDTSVTFGGCPVERLFMTDTLSYSDIFIVDMGEEFNRTVSEADHVYKLRVEVVMQRARHDHESKWRWEPNQYSAGMLMFYHTDFDELLKYAAEYLDEHHDPRPGLYEVWKANSNRRATFIKCVKHAPIGRVIHISEDPDYAKYDLD